MTPPAAPLSGSVHALQLVDIGAVLRWGSRMCCHVDFNVLANRKLPDRGVVVVFADRCRDGLSILYHFAASAGLLRRLTISSTWCLSPNSALMLYFDKGHQPAFAVLFGIDDRHKSANAESRGRRQHMLKSLDADMFETRESHVSVRSCLGAPACTFLGTLHPERHRSSTLMLPCENFSMETGTQEDGSLPDAVKQQRGSVDIARRSRTGITLPAGSAMD